MPRRVDSVDFGPELEGEHDDVYLGDLGDGDAVGDGEWRVENSFGTSERFVETGEIGLGVASVCCSHTKVQAQITMTMTMTMTMDCWTPLGN